MLDRVSPHGGQAGARPQPPPPPRAIDDFESGTCPFARAADDEPDDQMNPPVTCPPPGIAGVRDPGLDQGLRRGLSGLELYRRRSNCARWAQFVGVDGDS